MLQKSLRASIFALSFLICFTALQPAPLTADPEKLLVFAASSLKSALDPLARDFQTKTGNTVVVSYAASPALAKQILSGAPAGVFISADGDWMDYLEKNASLKSGSRKNITGNTLVLIAPKDSKIELTLAPNFPLSAALGNGRLAVAETSSVPAGKYAKAALEALGVWGDVQAKLAQTENVSTALLLVARGEAPLGIVYNSDAVSDPRVKVLGTFAATSHPKIVYPAAVTAASRSPVAGAFLEFLSSPQARAVFADLGYKPLD